MEFIDTHVHLDYPNYRPDLPQVLKRAAQAGVSRCITVGTDLPSSERALALAEAHPQIYTVIGLHPYHAEVVTADTAGVLAGLGELLESPRVVAIGEIGLDFYRQRAPRRDQEEAFRAQLRFAREVELPFVVHCRDAHPEVLEILREEGPPHHGVIHCFSGGPQVAATYLELGLHLSFTGILTYTGNDELRAAAASVPRDRAFVETDGPFLPPAPVRGRKPSRCEPGDVVHTAATLAECWGLSLAETAALTTKNAEAFFRLP